jgi:hypothetical protein
MQETVDGPGGAFANAARGVSVHHAGSAAQ